MMMPGPGMGMNPGPPMGMNPMMQQNKMMIPPLMTGMDESRKGAESDRRRYDERRDRERRDRDRSGDVAAGAESEIFIL